MKSYRKQAITYDRRYKYKLNMLEPGWMMIKLTGILLVGGLVLRLLRWNTLSLLSFALAGLVFVVLLLLVAIELHQDRTLNEIAMRENADVKDSRSSDCE